MYEHYGMLFFSIPLVLSLFYLFILLIFFIINRKNLYQDRYEYDNPMFYRGVAKFELVPATECDLDNPWKESFQQLVSWFLFFR